MHTIMKLIKVHCKDEQRPVQIKQVKKGDYFTLKDIPEPKQSQVWVMDGYERSEREYLAHKFSDINDSRYFKPTVKVYVDFIF